MELSSSYVCLEGCRSCLWQHDCSKTAEHTPLIALYVSNLFRKSGLPPGVLNIVSGFGLTADAALASHMDVDKIDLEQFQKILKYIRSGVESDATLECGGDRQPTVFSNVKVHQNATTQNGPWMITLDAPSLSSMQQAKNRALREEIHRTYISRASRGI
ncbi:Aldedh domain-containing protein [Artemisia annua]|uniref:Aldedh domain-containing protein n=1 Tax=Artemisia annua TaxID=35608 RepID=A0A2U1N0E7_ARTAN|nr:Aldedh domain-containing protein [Artemisia annua]